MIRDPRVWLRTVVYLIGRSGLSGASRALFYECRHCGTKLDAGMDICPVCDSTEITVYDL